MNQDANLYAKSCELQKIDANRVLNEYFPFLQWRGGDCIMDVGAAEGSVSLEVVLPKLPPNFKKFVLSDISEDLLDFARDRSDDERVQFCPMDISSTIPDGFRQHFDHIFSFYCLNWVSTRLSNIQALKNIFDMLKPGGDVVLTIMASSPLYDFWQNMALTEKWAAISKNLSGFLSPYHNQNNPEEVLREFLEEAGFVIHDCKMETRFYTYGAFSVFLGAISRQWFECDNTYVPDSGLSVNPFIHLLSEDERKEYIEDYEKEIRKHHEITVTGVNGNEELSLSYNIIIACASKPLESQ